MIIITKAFTEKTFIISVFILCNRKSEELSYYIKYAATVNNLTMAAKKRNLT